MQQALDIISLPIELRENMADSKFRLVHVASQRVRQLSAGGPVQVMTRSIKDSTIALEESVADRLRVIVGEGAKAAKEEFQKQLEKARLEEELSAKEEEIRKELSVYLSEAQDEEAGEEPGAAGPVEAGAEAEDVSEEDEEEQGPEPSAEE
jgi:DNA-directed RNA polymerase omega subunit